MTIFRLFRHLVLCGMIAAFFIPAGAGAGLAQAAHRTLTIDTSTGAHKFIVDVMRSEHDLEKGLMFRKSIPADYGMLFDFQHEQTVMMWMKNTYVPLDMIFIGRTGKVVGVIAHAKPMSEQILSIAAPTDAVLEVNAGTAAKIGLKVGDTVHDPIFGH